jgi:hypothetical protein
MCGFLDASSVVVPGLDPGIHQKKKRFEEDGLPGQARQ